MSLIQNASSYYVSPINSNFIVSSSNTITEKIWGEEHLLKNTFPSYTIKIMQLYPNCKCSTHMHKIKKESFILLCGQMIVETIDLKTGTNYITKLQNIGDSITLEPEVPHTFYCPEGQEEITVFLECSTKGSFLVTITASVPQSVQKILILGDLLIDETWYTKVEKLSPEAPVLITSLLSPISYKSPGGAGLAAAYAVKNKIPIDFMTIASPTAINILNDFKIPTINLKSIKHNTRKIRYIEKSSRYHLLRVDTDYFADQLVLSKSKYLDIFIAYLKNNKDIGCIAMLDYRKGFFKDHEFCKSLITIAREYNIPTFVDTRGNIIKFNKCNVAKLNFKEYNNLMEQTNKITPQELRTYMENDILLITKAEQGADAYSKNGTINIPLSPDTGCFDTTGAGDVFDINFCYYHFLKHYSLSDSVFKSVKKATEYVKQPIQERLC